MVFIIQTQMFICLHHSQSQEMAYNSEGRFFSGWKYISLWRLQEKRTVTALARRETLSPRTAPAGGRTACWQGPGFPPTCPPASSSSGSSVFIWCIFFRCKSSFSRLVWLLRKFFSRYKRALYNHVQYSKTRCSEVKQSLVQLQGALYVKEDTVQLQTSAIQLQQCAVQVQPDVVQ